MIRPRYASDRAHADHGWLNTYHTFSFADYYDPEQTGFRSLLVINEDRVRPGQGFGTHGHQDMEIISYVLSGALQHKDSMGNGSALRPGELQRISAGTGILHSEFNPSPSEPVHFYQIWLTPDREGYEPSYEQRRIDPAEMQGKLRLMASPDGSDGSLTIHQDARVYLAGLHAGQSVAHVLAPNRHAWLQVIRGKVTLNGESLATSDGVAVSDEQKLTIQSAEDTEVMLFDLP
jgi:redox-sensitive bicupin YhaK (pirin superfamily)